MSGKIYQFDNCEIEETEQIIAEPDYCIDEPDLSAGPYETWWEMDAGSCFYDGKNSTYMAVIDTDYSDTGGSELDKRLQLAVTSGVRTLLDFYNKSDTFGDTGVGDQAQLPLMIGFTNIAATDEWPAHKHVYVLNTEGNGHTYYHVNVSSSTYHHHKIANNSIIPQGQGSVDVDHIHVFDTWYYMNSGSLINVMESSGSFTGSYDENGDWVSATSDANISSSWGAENSYDDEGNLITSTDAGYVADTFANASSSLASQEYAAGINSELFLLTCADCHEWHLDQRPLMPLKALISVPSEIFDAIEEDLGAAAAISSNATVDEVVAVAGSFTGQGYVWEMEWSELINKIRRVSRALEIYATYAAAWAITEGGVVKGVNLASEGENLRQFKGAFRDLMSDNDISSLWLGKQKFEFTFSENYDLLQIRYMNVECKEPKVMKKGFQKFLNTSPINYKTSMAYLAQIEAMDIDVTAREPKGWQEFVRQYTVPQVEILTGDETIQDGDLSLFACAIGNFPIINAAAELVSEGGMKNLSQNVQQALVSELMSTGDLLIQQFGQNLCKDKNAKLIEDATLSDTQLIESIISLQHKAEDVIAHCQGDGIFSDIAPMIAKMDTLDQLYAGMLNPIGKCGFMAAIKTSLGCFAEGFGFDEMMERVLKSAINSMNEQVIGELIKRLPPELQAQILASAFQFMDENDLNAYLNEAHATANESVNAYNAYIEEREQVIIPDAVFGQGDPNHTAFIAEMKPADYDELDILDQAQATIFYSNKAYLGSLELVPDFITPPSDLSMLTNQMVYDAYSDAIQATFEEVPTTGGESTTIPTEGTVTTEEIITKEQYDALIAAGGDATERTEKQQIAEEDQIMYPDDEVFYYEPTDDIEGYFYINVTTYYANYTQDATAPNTEAARNVQAIKSYEYWVNDTYGSGSFGSAYLTMEQWLQLDENLDYVQSISASLGSEEWYAMPSAGTLPTRQIGIPWDYNASQNLPTALYNAYDNLPIVSNLPTVHSGPDGTPDDTSYFGIVGSGDLAGTEVYFVFVDNPDLYSVDIWTIPQTITQDTDLSEICNPHANGAGLAGTSGEVVSSIIQAGESPRPWTDVMDMIQGIIFMSGLPPGIKYNEVSLESKAAQDFIQGTADMEAEIITLTSRGGLWWASDRETWDERGWTETDAAGLYKSRYDMPVYGFDKDYGPETAAAVAKLQEDYGHTPEEGAGAIDSWTWMYWFSDFLSDYNPDLDPSTESSAVGAQPGVAFVPPTVQDGTKGWPVWQLQKKLVQIFGNTATEWMEDSIDMSAPEDTIDAGGRYDNDFGSEMTYVIEIIQTVLGLTVDGICGPETWSALYGYVSVRDGVFVPTGTRLDLPLEAGVDQSGAEQFFNEQAELVSEELLDEEDHGFTQNQLYEHYGLATANESPVGQILFETDGDIPVYAIQMQSSAYDTAVQMASAVLLAAQDGFLENVLVEIETAYGSVTDEETDQDYDTPYPFLSFVQQSEITEEGQVTIDIIDPGGIFYNLPSTPGEFGTSNIEDFPPPHAMGVRFDGEEMLDAVIDYYKAWILDYFTDRWDELLDIVEGMPGFDLAKKIFATLDCPPARSIHPPIGEWFNGLDINPCRSGDPIVLPKVVFTPRRWPRYNIKAIIIAHGKRILRALLMKLMLAILNKTFKFLSVSLCDILEYAGQLSASAMAHGIDGIMDDLRELANCPEEATDQEVAQATADLLQSIGITSDTSPGELAGIIEDTEQLVSTVGAVCTKPEYIALMNCEADESTYKMVSKAITIGAPAFADSLGNPIGVKKMFGAFCRLIDVDAFNRKYEALAENAIPVDENNPMLCIDGVNTEAFDQLRAALMLNKDPNMTDEQLNDQLNQAKRDLDDNMQDLADISQQGIDDYLADNLPPLFSDGGCQTPIIPAQPTAEDAGIAGGELTSDSLHNNVFGGVIMSYYEDILGTNGYMNNILSSKAGIPLRQHCDTHNFWGGREGLFNNPEASFPKTVGLYLRNNFMANHIGSYASTITGSIDERLILMPEKKSVYIHDAPSGINGYTGYEGMVVGEEGLEYQTTVDDPGNIGAAAVDSLGDILTYYRSADALLYFTDKDSAHAGSAKGNSYDLSLRHWTFIVDEETGLPSTDNIQRLVISEAAGGEDDLLMVFEADLGYTDGAAQALEELFPAGPDLSDKYSQQATAFATLITNPIRDSLYSSADILGDTFEEAMNELYDHLRKNTYNEINSKIINGFSFEICRPEANIKDADYDPAAAPAWYWGETLSGSNDQYPIGPMKSSAGLLGLAGKLVPAWEQCEPQSRDPMGWDSLLEEIDSIQGALTDDPRLEENPACVTDPPFDRVLSTVAKAGVEGAIMVRLRLSFMELFLRGYATMSTLNIADSKLWSAFVAEKILSSIKEDSGIAAKLFLGLYIPSLTPSLYYHEFLEQSVRVARRYIEEGLLEVTSEIEEADLNIKHITRKWNNNNVQGKLGFDPFKTKWKKAWTQNIAAGEQDAIVMLKALIQVKFEEFLAQVYDVLGQPKYHDIHSLFLGQSNKNWIPTMEVPTHVSEEDPEDRFGVLLDSETAYNSIQLGDNPDNSPDRFADGWFIIEKYIRIVDMEEDAETDVVLTTEEIERNIDQLSATAALGEIIDRDSMLKGVVNIETWKTFLNETFSTEDDSETSGKLFGNINEYFSNWYYGMRLCFVPGMAQLSTGEGHIYDTAIGSLFASLYDVATAGKDDIIAQEKAYFVNDSGRSTPLGIHGAGDPATKPSTIAESNHICPIVSVELKVEDMDIMDFDGSDYDEQCMLDYLKGTNEYKLLFEYCFPIKDHAAMLAIYNAQTFVASIGHYQAAGWEPPTPFTPATTNFAKSYEQADSPGDNLEAWGTVYHVNGPLRDALVRAFGNDSAPGGARGFTRWNQDCFEDAKFYVKKVFRDYYGADDSTYEDEEETATGGPQGQMRDFLQIPSIDNEESEPWWKRRRRKRHATNEERGYGCNELEEDFTSEEGE